ncbi:hypothetical protein [Paremcibacter congregatus]|uniref:HAD family hydrolase n=1 Tax=Paremcibacter congregatus TaxID=2043170 RepID=A0A2G4YMW0_9PROT|nr:hypothetical protein [Paremcibacter congregatus]PHZ83651.1 hypothetical protein CRD36_14825 [Paremcibacter congregatus]QDE27354.1 hypothetical protein FIV45_08650 [Paremcibacter congregatus]
MKHALEQLKSLSLNPRRPVIVTDADEVILHFADILSEYLASQDMYVNFVSYALEGNIKYRATDEPVSSTLFGQLIDDYFEKYVEKQPLVDGAVHHLNRLSELCNIVILTNIPHDFADRRRELFSRKGLPYPMISSSGPKGPALDMLSRMTDQPLFFIDDIAHHHTSVAKITPQVQRIQFIANRHLHSIETKAKDCHHRCEDWAEIERVIRETLLT